MVTLAGGMVLVRQERQVFPHLLEVESRPLDRELEKISRTLDQEGLLRGKDQNPLQRIISSQTLQVKDRVDMDIPSRTQSWI